MTTHHPTDGPQGWSGLSARAICLQSWLCHPDWDSRIHLHYLSEEEGINLEHLPAAPGDRSPHDTINRWLSEFKARLDS